MLSRKKSSAKRQEAKQAAQNDRQAQSRASSFERYSPSTLPVPREEQEVEVPTTDDKNSTGAGLIYSAPTVESLGDESSLIRPYPVPLNQSGGSAVSPSRQTTNASSIPLRLPSQQVSPQKPTRRNKNVSSSSQQKKRRDRNRVNKDFQKPEDCVSVRARSVPIAERSAFGIVHPPSIDEWHDIASKTNHKKLSPSLQHLQWIHKLQGVTHVRQLCFSPGLAPDIFEDQVIRERRDDGRYRSIDPVSATLQGLPKVPPLLSNKKHRLPLRSDVGFPHASEEEIRSKQKEIQQESEWEEASPRLAVLVTSDDLGIAVQEEGEPMPWAGPELDQQKERNKKHFGKGHSNAVPSANFQPNRYSALAPPLDATFSSRLHWRPRAFHDRAPGMEYILACPLSIKFDIGTIEPLVGTLSLYYIPPDGAASKVSEDFYFPAGDWKNRVDLDCCRVDGRMDSELLDSWHRRSHKAIFSYNPLEVKREYLHVVVQIFKTAHVDPTLAYADSTLNSSSKSKSKRNLFKKKGSNVNSIEQTKIRANAVLDNFGTQFLTPLCFGTISLNGNSNAVWPSGTSREIAMYLSSPRPQSQEEFCAKLERVQYSSNVSFDTQYTMDEIPGSSSKLSALVESPRETNSVASSTIHSSTISAASDMSPASSKMSKSVRRFMTPRKQSSSKRDPCGVDVVLGAKATVFTSSLKSDFLQVMLSTPPELGNNEGALQQSIPKLLVDCSGKAGIMMDEPINLIPNAERKRSNLVRLPEPQDPGTYLESAEFREVLFFAPRKHFETDSAASYRSLLNILYLYPRLLKQEKNASGGNKGKHRFTIRARLVRKSIQNGSANEETSSTVLQAFHSSAPWAGPTLLKNVFTRVHGSSQKLDSDDMKSGVPMKDEFKMNLPAVLDGSYFLHFTLFSIDIDDSDDSSRVGEEGGGCSISIHPVEETSIPLSSSSIRDPKTGIKATTIIPNGCHRLKLGDFQLQFETRLFSTVHVSDPAVSSALRNFSSESSSKEQISYSTLLNNASGSSLRCHFQALLSMHLANMIWGRENGGAHDNDDVFLLENMRSLLELCRGVKESILLSTSDARAGRRMFAAFVKATVDSFDEDFLGPSLLNQSVEDDDGSDVVVGDNMISEQIVFDDNDQDDNFDGGAIRKRKKSSLPTSIDIRLSKSFSVMESSSEVPFSRTAYGASKTERMRLEAELDADVSRLTHLFDDDETVLTAATGLQTSFAETKMAEARELMASKSFSSKWDASAAAANSALDRRSSLTEDPDFAPSPAERHQHAYQRSFGDSGLAQRVRSAAEIMLAPCVGPNLPNVLASRFSPVKKTHRSNMQPNESNLLKKTGISNTLSSMKSDQPEEFHLTSSGSEIEDVSDDDIEQYGYHTNEGLFRSPVRCPVLVFSIQVHSGYEHLEVPINRGAYLYESILVLFLRSYLDHSKDGKDPEKPNTEERIGGFLTFCSNADMLLPICLKSIALRFTHEIPESHPRTSRVILDEAHMALFEPFVETLTRGVMVQAMSADVSDDEGLKRALVLAEALIDFLIGLLAIAHPAHLEVLLLKYFHTLRNCEIEQIQSSDGEIVFRWTDDSLRRVRASRQLRLRAIEKLSVLPNFVALNYPLKYSPTQTSYRPEKATWTNQYVSNNEADHVNTGKRSSAESENLLPRSGWLAEILTEESLSICALSCEAVVAEAMAHIETHDPSNGKLRASSLLKRPTASLKRNDLLMFQSIAIHAITVVYELLLRRHAMDKRFQTENCRSRIAALFTKPIFEKSLASVRWLSRMESTHKVRSLWLLCFAYALQETPESLLRYHVTVYSNPTNPKDIRIHRFIRLLRLGSSTFQSFIDQPRHSMFPSEIDKGISPWLLQEAFNIICATTIVVVEECGSPSSALPKEQKKIIHGVLDLLLHVLTTPQSSVTHLRAVGGAIQAFESFGIDMFLEITGGNLQHWLRIILSLMNSTALSVRSIAVDFVISLLGSAYSFFGNIDEISLIFITVLPEVVAREIGLCSVSGHIGDLSDVEKSVWPLRRSFADIEDANPLDDDRVDPQLSPILSVFCRACQAAMDGVLIELRLKGSRCNIVGTHIKPQPFNQYTFDADEESLFEAANFFIPEVAPLQRLRWLLTLKALHEAKGQWIEAAETLMLCARTITDAIPHLLAAWRPSRFVLWSDSRRSLWLSTVGEELGHPERGNQQVMAFADNFLEPAEFQGLFGEPSSSGKLPQPTVLSMCRMLTKILKDAVACYAKEDGMDEHAYSKLESLLKVLMGVIDSHGESYSERGTSRFGKLGAERKRFVEDEAALRRVIASLSGDMTKLAEKLLLIVQDEPKTKGAKSPREGSPKSNRPFFVRVQLSGKKPPRFVESTTIPTYMEWGVPFVGRVPSNLAITAIGKARGDPRKLEDLMCSEFAKPIRDGLKAAGFQGKIELRTGRRAVLSRLESGQSADSGSVVYLDISFVRTSATAIDKLLSSDSSWEQSKHLYYLADKPSTSNNVVVEMTVAHPFPCALSRQRALLTNEILSVAST